MFSEFSKTRLRCTAFVVSFVCCSLHSLFPSCCCTSSFIVVAAVDIIVVVVNVLVVIINVAVSLV